LLYFCSTLHYFAVLALLWIYIPVHMKVSPRKFQRTGFWVRVQNRVGSGFHLWPFICIKIYSEFLTEF
jgi:hypothetical protein